MNKENNISLNLTSLVDYIRDKDVIIEGLNYRLNDYIRMCENYERVIDNIKEYIKNTNCYGIRSGKTLLQRHMNDILKLLEKINE